MPTCETSVTTPTGVFTYYDGDLTYNQAKVACAKKQQILAPITNKFDYEALLRIADSRNGTCEFHRVYLKYHIGLDVRKNYAGIETRLFTNNIIWNDTEHGPLYWERGHETKDINSAVLFPLGKKMGIVRDYGNSKRRYICLKPSVENICAEPLTEKSLVYNMNYGVLFTCGNLIIVVAGIMFMMKIKRSKTTGSELNAKVEEKYGKIENSFS